MYVVSNNLAFILIASKPPENLLMDISPMPEAWAGKYFIERLS